MHIYTSTYCIWDDVWDINLHWNGFGPGLINAASIWLIKIVKRFNGTICMGSFFWLLWLLLGHPLCIFAYQISCVNGVHSSYLSCLLKCHFYSIINLSFQWSFILHAHNGNLHFTLSIRNILFFTQRWIENFNRSMAVVIFYSILLVFFGVPKRIHSSIMRAHQICLLIICNNKNLFSFLQMNELTFMWFPHLSRKINLGRNK